jgi:hypothetical protein
MSRSKRRGGKIPYPFVPFPVDVLRSAEFVGLSDAAKALLFDLVEQYTGGNNGRLTPSWTAMQRRGWGGQHKLIRAKREILATSFCILTRKGKPPQTAEWLGFTWWRLDYQPTMDVNASKWPYLNFLLPKVVQLGSDHRPEKLTSVVPKQHRSNFSGSAKTAPIEASVEAL